MISLIRRYWYDEGNSDNLVYFEVWIGDKAVTTTTMYDIREFFEDSTRIKEFRQEVDELCQHYGIIFDTSGDDYNEWK